jgi:hypothetical protein
MIRRVIVSTTGRPADASDHPDRSIDADLFLFIYFTERLLSFHPSIHPPALLAEPTTTVVGRSGSALRASTL